MGTFQPRVTTTTNRRIHTQGDSSTSSQSINSTPTVSMHQTQQQSSNGQAGQQPTSSLTQQQTQQQQQQQQQHQQQVQSQGSGQSQGQSQPHIQQQQQQQTSLSVQGQAAPVRSTMVTTQVQQPTMTMTGPPQQPQPHQMLPPVPQSRMMATSPMPTTMQYNPHNQTSVQSPLVLATPAPPPPPQPVQHQPPPPPTPVNYGAVTPYAPRPQSMVLPPDPSVILPYLLLGGSFTNKNPEIIYYMRISHIINMAVELPPSYHLANLAYNRNIIYKHLPSDDSLQYNIRVHFEDAFQMIDAARMSNGRALVHCMMGISRSATVVIAYLMSRYNMSMRDAYLWVKSRRPEIQPNPLFLRILEDFERDLIQQRIKNDYVARSMYNNRTTTTTAAAAPVAPVTVIEPHDKRYYHMPKNVIIKPAATQMLALPAPPTPHTTTYTMQHTSPGMPTQTMTYHHPHHHHNHHTNTIPGPIIITQHRPNMRPQSYVGYPNYAY